MVAAPAPEQQQRAVAPTQLRAVGGITLDFETGDLRGWTASGNAFESQPTYGDNSAARGNQPANQQGDFWIGTFERHPRGATSPGSAQGDRPQGTLTSQAFDIPGGTLSFLIGGGSSFETRVELMIADPIEGSIRAFYASGSNTESMRRVTWDLARLNGQRGFLRIVDQASGPWGHINVDDFRFSAAGPRLPDLDISRQPELELTPQVATTRVPELRGRDLDTARAMLARLRLEVGSLSREPSRQQQGVILGQEPEPGTVVRVGSAVALTLAVAMQNEGEITPPPSVAVVPDVIGRDQRAALQILRAAGFPGRVVGQRPAQQAPGTVIGQQPQGGSRAERGGLVQLVTAAPVQDDVPPQPELVVVPDVVGRDERAAFEILRAAGFQGQVVDRREARQPPGTVIGQRPEAGSRVQPGGAVQLVTALPLTAVVPNLIGGSADTARRALDDVGLQVGSVGQEESTEPEGSVVSQDIEAGRRVEQGTAVDFAVAIPVMRTVPDVVGRRDSEARRQLEAAGLQAGNVTQEESRGETGVVLRQSVAPGTSVVLGAVVDLVVSTPMTAVVPELVGLPEAEARGQLEAAELVVGTVVETESRREPGIIVTQSERAGSRVVLGTPVDMLVSVPVTVVVPDLSGRSVAEARGLLEGLELGLGDVGSRESRQPEGSVLSQQPGAGTRIEINTAIDVVVAEPVTVLVPDVVGFAEGAANGLLRDAELTVAGVTRRESRQPVGTVLEQDVTAGERVVIGTPVSLVLAEPVTVLVPEVVGRGESAATAALEEVELALGEVSYQESAAAVGTVLTQSLNPGTRVQIGTPINLLVAVVETVAVPELVGLPVEEARRSLVTGRLEVGNEELRETRIETEGTVLEQSRAAGTAAAVGTAVNLIVATPEIITVPPLVGLSEEEAVAVIRGAGLVVGAVGEALSAQEGGTVLQQAQPAGSQVVFGTPIGLQVARDRTIWVVPTLLALLLVAGAGTVAARRRGKGKGKGRRSVRRPPEPADEKPPLPEIHARPVADPGRQTIDGGAEENLTETEIRLRPTIGPGAQELRSPDDLIAGEEREHD